MIQQIMKNKFLISLLSLISLSFSTYTSAQEKPNFNKISEEAQQHTLSETQSLKEYTEWSLNYNKKVFEWNYISSIIIFIVMISIIILGIYFALIQFRNSTNHRESKDFQTSIKISANGIEISSSVIGLLTLLISLAFLYLYLENIHQISRIDLEQGSVQDKK